MIKKTILIFTFGFVIGVLFQKANEMNRGLIFPIAIICFLILGFFAGFYINSMINKLEKFMDRKSRYKKKKFEKMKMLVQKND